MLNVNDLELRHKKYKKSYYYPYLIVFAVVIIVLMSVLLFTLYNENLEIKTEARKEQIVISTNLDKKIETLKDDTNNTQLVFEQNSSLKDEVAPILEIKKIEEKSGLLEIKEEKIEETKRVILTPSLNFINNIESNTVIKNQTPILLDTKEIKVENIEPMTEEVKHIEQNIAQKTIEVIETKPVHIEEKKGSINIERKDEENDIADVIKRFNINHNPALSLFIAKRYYQLGNWEQAYNFALMTNDINNNIEGSWIIFSKSLVKMNKKELAIETLKKYISFSSSSQAKQLLDEITSGKFK